MTPEKKVKQKVVKLLKSRGCYWFYPAAGNRVTALQQKNLTDIQNCGGYGIVVSGDLSELEKILDDLEK